VTLFHDNYPGTTQHCANQPQCARRSARSKPPKAFRELFRAVREAMQEK